MRVLDRFPVIAREEGRYHAFPTLASVGGEIWCTFRSGTRDPERPHGRDGGVRLLRAPAADPRAWRALALELEPAQRPHCEMDAIVTPLGRERLLLMTREYRRGYNQPFVSVVSADEVLAGAVLARRPLGGVTARVGAAFGHALRGTDGRWYQCAYGAVAEHPGVAALWLGSDDALAWTLVGVLIPPPAPQSGHGGWSEASAAHLPDGSLTALVRCQEPPFPLMTVGSADGGATWSVPRESGLFGHAPMLLRRRDGRVLALYRALEREPAGVALAEVRDGAWCQLGRVAEYPGNPYDGGYGDLLELPGGELLVVYYRAEGDRSPWLEGVVVALD